MTDVRFKSPTSIMISGPTQCGKTVLTRKLLTHAQELFSEDVSKIVYCYGAYQPSFLKFQQDIPNINFVEGFPDNVLELFEGKSGILVIDDMMSSCSNDERMADIMTKFSHHQNITVIYLVQNLFPPGKYSRTISLNCHYIFAFENSRDSLGISNLIQQAFRRKAERSYALW